VRYCSDVRAWQTWEVECFNSLNGPAFSAARIGRDTVCADRISGRSFWEYMTEGALTPQIVEAAAHALRRAHEFWSDDFDDWWSHGDASTSNVIYDASTGRAHLIDFEMLHQKSLPAEARHADDLLVFLLDTTRFVPERQWVGFALHFLTAYGKAEAIERLRTELIVPRGLARIWWGVRTNFASSRMVNRHFGMLRRALVDLEVSPRVGSRTLAEQPSTFE
jgi:tRNA A-37 threonylcarbamoyl transferase component Bud32